MRSVRLTVLAVASLFCFTSVAWAQISGVNDTTSTPIAGSGHDYIKMLNESVTPANGSVSLRIEVPVPKGRGPTLPFSFAYDSNGVFTPWINNVNGTTATQNTNETFLLDGWSYGLPLMSVVDIVISPKHFTQPECDDSTEYIFQSSGGTRYFLPVVGGRYFSPTSACDQWGPSGSNDFYQALLSTTDSNGDTYNGKLTLASSAGKVYTFPNLGSGCPIVGKTGKAGPATSIEDRNGNVISLSGCSAFTATDTAGRTVLSASGFGATGNTVTVSGLSQPYTLTWGTASQNFTMGSTPRPEILPIATQDSR